MKETWRWFGPDDPVTLAHSRQAGATGIVTALHHLNDGRAWPRDEVMKRNPYHFGALSGYGHIHVEFKLYEQAIEYFQKALKINPNMVSVVRLIERLERQLKDQRSKSV